MTRLQRVEASLRRIERQSAGYDWMCRVGWINVLARAALGYPIEDESARAAVKAAIPANEIDPSKRASYRKGVEWIALNDDPAAGDAQEVEAVAGYISTMLLADLFGVSSEDVAKDIIRYRKRAP